MSERPLAGRVDVFVDDQEYLESYAEICRFLNERYELLEDMCSSMGVALKDQGSREQAHIRCRELDQVIQDSEWYFWEKVEYSKRVGRHFVFEELSDNYGFDHLEKRLVLFFLCSSVLRARDFSLSRLWIIEIFNMRGSIMEKIQHLSLLNEDRTLIKDEILVKKDIGRSNSPDTAYRLNPQIRDIFSQKLRGIDLHWPETTKEKYKESAVQQIGYIKDPDHSFDDVVLPSGTRENLNFFLKTYNTDTFERLGVDKVIKKAKGLSFLFYGPPGTGKSMLAEAVASSLEKKVLVVETPRIFSCWLGETDKNIQKMFECARENDLLLLLDEADSLLYRRNLSTADHTVRFTNVMLTELERFEGIAVFTSNMGDLLDEAMERRIALKVKFEIPKPPERASIWKSHVPPNVKFVEDIDFELLSMKYEFTGGYIKNAVLNAIRRLACRESDILTMEDLIFGADMEGNGMFNKKQKRRTIGFKNTT